ncbi:MAG: lipopolysaccharide biosynthesis protein [Phycisphaerae bacterium]
MPSERGVNETRSGATGASGLERDGAIAVPGHSLKRNILFAMLGNGVLNLCRFAVVVLLAKFAGEQVQGTFTYTSIAWAVPVVLFCGLELRAAFVADAGGEFTFGAYRALRSLGMGAASVVLLVVVLWTTRSEASVTLVWMMLAICAGRIVFHQAEVYWGVYQRRERLDLMAWSNALRGATMLAPFAILLMWPRLAGHAESNETTPERLMQVAAWAVSIYVVAWAAIWWLFDRRLVVGHADVNLSWDWPALWKLAKQTLPLGLVFLLINLCETVTQWFVKRAAGGEGWSELGYFGALRFITLGATFLIVQVSTAAGNRLANYYQKDLRSFVRLATKLTGAAVALGVTILAAAWLFGEWFLRVVYTAKYAQHYFEFLILVSAQAVVVLATVFGFVTTHMRQFWIQVPVQVSVLAVTAVAAMLLVQPEDPVRGGAWTMVVRSSTQAVLYFGCVLIGIRWRDRILASR